jgi:hypothetical protein
MFATDKGSLILVEQHNNNINSDDKKQITEKLFGFSFAWFISWEHRVIN